MAILPNQLRAVQTARQVLEQKPVYIDTETTGVDKNAEIVEISIVNHDGTVIFESLIRPQQPIPPEVIAIHHITNEMVLGKPTWPAIWPTIRSYILGRIVATYNADFDLRMMQQSFTRYKLPWKENLKMFCVMKLYAEFRGEWDSRRGGYRYFTLERAGADSRISLPNSHRASDDSLLARSLLHYMASFDNNQL
jgi:DNA polymerase III subunit epsilon